MRNTWCYGSRRKLQFQMFLDPDEPVVDLHYLAGQIIKFLIDSVESRVYRNKPCVHFRPELSQLGPHFPDSRILHVKADQHYQNRETESGEELNIVHADIVPLSRKRSALPTYPKLTECTATDPGPSRCRSACSSRNRRRSPRAFPSCPAPRS